MSTTTTCLGCAATLRPEDKYCPACGQRIEEARAVARTRVAGVPEGAARQWIGPGELFADIEVSPTGNPDPLTLSYLASVRSSFPASVSDDVIHWDISKMFASLGPQRVATIAISYRDLVCPGTGITLQEALDVFEDGVPTVGWRPGKNKQGKLRWISAYATAVHFFATACRRTA